jgi:hypothetical protein
MHDVVITTSGSFKQFQIDSWTSATASPDALRAASIERISAKGEFVADVTLSGGSGRTTLKNADMRTVTGGTWSVTGNAGDISVRSADDWAFMATGNLKSLRSHASFTDSTVSAANIEKVDLKGGADNITVMAGANLGSDARMGGADAAADTFAGGTIKQIDIKGGATTSFFAAGVNPINSVLGDTDDVFLDPSRIGKVKVRGDTTGTLFLASNRTSSSGGNNNGGNTDRGGNNNGGNTDRGGNNNGGNTDRDNSDQRQDDDHRNDRSNDRGGKNKGKAGKGNIFLRR